MDKRGKRYNEIFDMVDRHKVYSIKNGIDLLLETATANFDETIDLAVRLGVEPKHADQQVRGAVVLPHGTGRDRTVVVIAKGDKAAEAEAAGADFVGADDIVDRIQNENWLDFDVVVATPDMMGVVGKIGRILGPKGLMPNPKSGTVTFDIEQAVKEIKAGKVEYRVDSMGIVHVPIGKDSFGEEKLRENFIAMMDELIKAKPVASKGVYLQSVTLSSTMGPGIKVNAQKLMDDED